MDISIPIVIVLVIAAIWSGIQRMTEFRDVMNADKLLQDLNDGKITILDYCEHKVSHEQQKICTDYKNRFGLK